MLSDHDPITVRFSWTRNPAYRLSDQFGGPHGDYFTDLGRLPAGARATDTQPPRRLPGRPDRPDPGRRHHAHPRRRRRHREVADPRRRRVRRRRASCAAAPTTATRGSSPPASPPTSAQPWPAARPPRTAPPTPHRPAGRSPASTAAPATRSTSSASSTPDAEPPSSVPSEVCRQSNRLTGLLVIHPHSEAAERPRRPRHALTTSGSPAQQFGLSHGRAARSGPDHSPPASASWTAPPARSSPGRTAAGCEIRDSGADPVGEEVGNRTWLAARGVRPAAGRRRRSGRTARRGKTSAAWWPSARVYRRRSGRPATSRRPRRLGGSRGRSVRLRSWRGRRK